MQMREPCWYACIDANGSARYPSSLLEAGFHVACAIAAVMLYRGRRLSGQLFHAYLLAYGAFRLVHEAYRETPRLFANVSTYQVLAIVLIVFAGNRMVVRMRATAPRTIPSGA